MLLTEAGKQLHEGLQSIERQLRLLKTDVTAAPARPGDVARCGDGPIADGGSVGLVSFREPIEFPNPGFAALHRACGATGIGCELGACSNKDGTFQPIKKSDPT